MRRFLPGVLQGCYETDLGRIITNLVCSCLDLLESVLSFTGVAIQVNLLQCFIGVGKRFVSLLFSISQIRFSSGTSIPVSSGLVFDTPIFISI